MVSKKDSRISFTGGDSISASEYEILRELRLIKEEMAFIRSFIENNPHNVDNPGWKRCLKELKDMQRSLEEHLVNGDTREDK